MTAHCTLLEKGVVGVWDGKERRKMMIMPGRGAEEGLEERVEHPKVGYSMKLNGNLFKRHQNIYAE